MSAPDNLGEPAFDEARNDSGFLSRVAPNRPDQIKGKMSEPAEQEPESKLIWPPTKEDLLRLYVKERLSARRIAKVYGLKYASEKTAESTVLYHLKRNGIERRDPAEHIRKVTEEMVDEWAKRYERGESLKQIAGSQVSPVTVFTQLRKRGIQLRDKVEAQISAVTIHQRIPFSGDDEEKAYLVGFRIGDLDAIKHGRAVRVRTATTHPAFAELFQKLFGLYGYVHEYPRRARLADYEWSLEADLDGSFEFLLLGLSEVPREFTTNPGLFHCFLAGFFDAEGSIYFHRKKLGGSFEITISNVNLQLLSDIFRNLGRLNYYTKWGVQDQDPKRDVKPTSDKIGKIWVWRRDEVIHLLREMPLQHQEKILKGRLALRFLESTNRETKRQVLLEWNGLLRQIKSDRDGFEELARKAIESKQE